MRLATEELRRRARALEWLLCDVDGVLTDGRIFVGRRRELVKAFDVRDGLGVKLAQRGGLTVGLLSSRRSPAVARRARELGITEVLQGRDDKAAAFADLLERRGLEARRVAYIGDDLPDLPVLLRCGLGFCPAAAAPEVRSVAHVVLERPGGRGAVRETVETILRARGDWADLLAAYSPDG